MGTSEMRDFARRASSAAGEIRSGGNGTAGDLLSEAAEIADDADELLALADAMLRENVAFVVPFVNDLDGRRARSMAAMRAYAERRGIRVLDHAGREPW